MDLLEQKINEYEEIIKRLKNRVTDEHNKTFGMLQAYENVLIDLKAIKRALS